MSELAIVSTIVSAACLAAMLIDTPSREAERLHEAAVSAQAEIDAATGGDGIPWQFADR